MTEFLLAPVMLIVVFLAAICAMFCLIKGFIYIVRNKEGFLPYIFYTSTFVTMLQVISGGRNMFLEIDPSSLETDPGSAVSLEGPSYVIWISRINTMLILYAASQRIVSRLMHYGSKPHVPTLLIITFLFFFFTNVVTAAIFSAHPSFEHYFVYLVLAGTASLLFVQGEEEISIRAARNTFFIFLVLSIGFIPLNPGMVFSNNYLQGLIPGLTYRYVGLADHPNSLGTIVILFMLCLWSKPFASRWINFLGWTIGYLSLVLAQSKTSWVGFIICMSCIGYFKYGDCLKQRFFDFKNPVLPASFILMAMMTAGTMLGLIMFSNIGNIIDSFFSTRAGEELMTMTGRTQIWAIAIDEWRNSPIFGYGLSIWDEAHRAKIGMPMAVTAHSQFYQTLASAGGVGVVGLLTYVMTLFWFALKTAKSSEGLTLAIFMMLFFRSISEVSLPVAGHFSLEELAHLLLLMIISAQFKPVFIKKPKTPLVTYQRFVSSRGF